MGSQRGARPTYNLPFSPFSPQLLFLPYHRSVPSSFNLAAGAKESGERESPRDTAHLQTSHSCLLPPSSPPLSCHLVSLLCPRLSLLPARSRSSSPQFCLRFNFLPASLAFLTLRSRAHNPGDARHLVIFVLRSASFCLNLNSSDLNVFFFVHLNVFHI